ncbi:MAG: hypothetical protein ACTSP4_00105 [Candidatus Hodarchaeales archaeon]
MLKNKNNLVCKYCKNQANCIVENILECDIFRINSQAFIRVNGISKIERILTELQEPDLNNCLSSAIKLNRKSIIKNRNRIAKLEYNMAHLVVTFP